MSACIDDDAEPTQNGAPLASADDESPARSVASCKADDVLACYMYILLHQSCDKITPTDIDFSAVSVPLRLTDEPGLPEPEESATAHKDTGAGFTDSFPSNTAASMVYAHDSHAPVERLADETRAYHACLNAPPNKMKSKNEPGFGSIWPALLFAIFFVALLRQTGSLTCNFTGIGLCFGCITALWLFARVIRATKYKQD